MRAFIISFFVLLLAGCSYGEAEFQIYRQAYEIQFSQGSKVVDRLGEAERTIADRRLARLSPTREFDPDDSKYVLAVGDPPLTEGLRRSLNGLKSYNDAMTGLVSGTSSAAIAANLNAVNTGIGDTAIALTGVTGVAAGFASSLSSSLGKIAPVLELAQTARSRAEFRKQMLLAYPDMRLLLETLRKGTPDMFAVLKRSREGRRVLGTGGSSLSASAISGLEEDRRLLSGWVILLDKTLLAMDDAVKAVEAGAVSPKLSELVATTVDLKATAIAIESAGK